MALTTEERNRATEVMREYLSAPASVDGVSPVQTDLVSHRRGAEQCSGRDHSDTIQAPLCVPCIASRTRLPLDRGLESLTTTPQSWPRQKRSVHALCSPEVKGRSSGRERVTPCHEPSGRGDLGSLPHAIAGSSFHANPCAAHIEPKSHHWLAHTIEFCALGVIEPTTHDEQRRFVGDKDDACQPVSFEFLLAIPIAVAVSVQGRACRMQEQSVGDLVSYVACPASRTV